ARGHEDRRSLHTDGRVAREAVQEEIERKRARFLDRAELHAASLPGAHQQVDADGQGERNPSAVKELDDVRAQEREVDQEEAADERADLKLRPPPSRARDDAE